VRRPKADCDALIVWLKGNLPRGSLGALTGTDSKALAAAVHVLRLYAYTDDLRVLGAFRLIVEQMATREFAYHAIAYVSEWENREAWWALAGLPPIGRVWVCAFEPAGRAITPEARWREGFAALQRAIEGSEP
jgi:hypothetical protein